MPTIESTIEFIKQAHAGQVDKAGQPYYLHPIAVMERMKSIGCEYAGDTGYLAALLHDILEDTDYTSADLRSLGYRHGVIEIVELLTNKPGEDYLEKIRTIIKSKNIGAMFVKYADIQENLDGARLSLLPKSTAKMLKEKYEEPLLLLIEAIERWMRKFSFARPLI